MTIKLLAVGDMHLGRRPSRLPDDLAGDGDRYGPAEAWRRIVRHAIEQDVDVVALAGDLVERNDDFFEAYPLLKQGVEDLAGKGIAVVGVVGNHDVRVLPRLAEELQNFDLLGADGQWQTRSYGQGENTITLHGWSFPSRHYDQSPLAGVQLERGPGLNLGLLHCDRDARDSRYAPVTSTELEAAGLDGWLLGHIHKPDELTVQHPSGYLGSISGLHPGEHGVRGPWLIETLDGRIEHVEQVRLAPLHWERMELDLTGIEQADQAESRLIRQIEALDDRLDEHEQPPEAVGIRLRLTGRTNRATEVLQQLADGLRNNPSTRRHVFIEKFETHTRPEQDLEQLAEKGNHIGLLARRLLLLDRPADDPVRRQLLEGARQRLQGIMDEPRWVGLDRADLDHETVAEQLRDTGARVLEKLILQEDGRS